MVAIIVCIYETISADEGMLTSWAPLVVTGHAPGFVARFE